MYGTMYQLGYNFIRESLDPETPTPLHISKLDFVNTF